MSLSGAVCFGTFSRPALLWILLLSLLFTITIAANETQLCYYDVGKLAGPEIIPCFEGGSVSPCCKIGSTCLYDNSCYDATTGVTYQYGCTDSTYKDSNCPQKCDLDTEKSNWVGLIYCDGTKGTPNNTWACHHPDNCGKKCPSDIPWNPLLQTLPAGTCSDLSPISTAFTGPNSIASVMSLPSVVADVSSYLAAHSANIVTTSSAAVSTTSVPTASIPTASVPTIAVSIASATFTNSPAPATHTSKSNTGLIIGLIFGIGIPVVLAAVGLWIWRRKRAQPRAYASPSTYSKEEDFPGSSFPLKAELPGSVLVRQTEYSELDGASVPAYEEAMKRTDKGAGRWARTVQRAVFSLFSPMCL